MASKPISITLPSGLLAEVERASKAEHRTRSELIREALRHYLNLRRVPIEEVTAEEHAAIEEGEAEIAHGDYTTLDELKHELGLTARRKSPKKRSKVSS